MYGWRRLWKRLSQVAAEDEHAIGLALKDRGVLTGIPQEKIYEISVSEVDD